MPYPVSFLDHFSALRDPRQAANVLYPLDEILLLVLAGTLAGADASSRSRSGGTPSSPSCAAFRRSGAAFPTTTASPR